MSIKQGGVTIAGGSSTVTDMDNITITKNAYSKIQTVGQINKNTATGAENYLYDWVGTLEEYNTQDIVTNHPEWICYITDDDIGSVINDSTITIKQGGITKGFFTLNQDTNKTINLDAGGGGGGTVAIDEVTITENGENKIQASATRNANLSNTSTTSVFDWVGTYQEYSDQNIAVNHPTWICFITDDIEGGVVTKTISPESGSNSNDVVTTEYENRFRSNCLINIQQDINLELSSGTLTLKAGSKVYMPNGDGNFDVINVTTDKSISSTNNGVSFVWYNTTTNALRSFPRIICYSGTSAPSGYTYMLWYDTTNNAIKITEDGGTTWASGQSFPVCMITGNSSNQILSLDQVFNGFGYIGQCTFTLPGVVGLIPNGRNTDGTLKNTILKSDNVIVHDLTGQTSKFGWFANGTDGIGLYGWGVYNYIESDNYPILKSGTTHAAWYDTKNNLIKTTNNGGLTWTLEQKIFISQLQKDSSSGNITAIETKKTIQVADQNDSFLRRFITVDKIVASGAGGIAGTYDLGFKDGKIKLGVFAGLLSLSQAGFSCLTIKSDVCDREVSLGATNNQFRNDSAATIPFINKITIGFSETSGGVSSAGVVFVGYL